MSNVTFSSVKARIQSFNIREANAKALQAAQRVRPRVSTKPQQARSAVETGLLQQKNDQDPGRDAQKSAAENLNTVPDAQKPAIEPVETQAGAHHLHDHHSLHGKTCRHAGNHSASQAPASYVAAGAKRHGQGDTTTPWGFWSSRKSDTESKPAELCDLCRIEAGLEPITNTTMHMLKKPLTPSDLSTPSLCIESAALSGVEVVKLQQTEVLHNPQGEIAKGMLDIGRSRIPLPSSPQTTLSSISRSKPSVEVFSGKQETPILSDPVSLQFKEKVHDALIDDLGNITRMLDAIILEHSAKLQEVTANLSHELSKLSVEMDSAQITMSKGTFSEPHRSIAQLTPQLHAQSDTFHALVKLVEAAADSWRPDADDKLPGHELNALSLHSAHHDREESSTYHSVAATECASPIISNVVAPVTNIAATAVVLQANDKHIPEQLLASDTSSHAKEITNTSAVLQNVVIDINLAHDRSDGQTKSQNTDESTKQGVASTLLPDTSHVASTSGEKIGTGVTTSEAAAAVIIIAPSAALSLPSSLIVPPTSDGTHAPTHGLSVEVVKGTSPETAVVVKAEEPLAAAIAHATSPTDHPADKAPPHDEGKAA